MNILSVMIKNYTGFFFLMVTILFCVPLTDSLEELINAAHPGMIKIQSNGKSFKQGWNGSLASLDERPEMRSAFTYDYWLDSTEVTQREYYEVTGRGPVDSSSSYGVGDNYPVYYVSWFDAVLYCNGRSKAEYLDTVYMYTGIKALQNGTVYELTGIRSDLSRDGYRLPTEAEWEYAARGGSSDLPFTAVSDSSSACYYAWYVANSSGKTHVVATRLANRLGLYDMAGNVFEWTNDWKGMYNGKDITNSLGAHLPGNGYEKVIKGGAYNYSVMDLRPSHRSATYATTLSTVCEYVGFRCARGPIPNGQYIGLEQVSFVPNPVTILASTYDLYMFLGTSKSKFVFVNVTGSNRTLCYIDFSRMFPYVVEYVDDKYVYKPVISPDGRYVAYCGNNEGMSVGSKISVRSLDSLNTAIVRLDPDTAYIPRWWVDPSSGDTCIVYTNSGVKNDNNAVWLNTKTFSQKISGGRPVVGSVRELISDGSYHDGISVNGRYAVTGFTRLMVKDLQLPGGGMQLFMFPENGKDTSGSTQVCNVSISPDTGSGVRCMFLDFGYPYPKVSSVTGSSYGIHEYLFVSRMSGEITNYVHCPAGEEEWDNPNWTNQSRFGVGCGRNGGGQAHAVYAIDLESKASKPIVTGTELQQPYLWMGGVSLFNFALDSLGMYNDPPLSGLASPLSWGMHLFWQKHNSLAVVVTGSSQTIEGIDCSLMTEITGLPSLNMSYCGCGLTGMIMLIRDYVVVHCPKIRVICMGMALRWMADSGGNFFDLATAGVTQSKGFLYDQSHNFWSSGLPPQFEEIASNAPFINCCQLDTFGFLSYGCRGWGPDTPICAGRTDWDTGNAVYKTNFALLKSLVDELRALQIHLITIIHPENPGFIKYNTGFFALGGPSLSTGIAIVSQLKSLENGNPYFHFYDAYKNGNHDYGCFDFIDACHPCVDGAKKLTSRLDTLIDSILK